MTPVRWTPARRRVQNVLMRITMIIAAVAALAVGLAAQEEFKKSDPALLSTTGRPQLVEFYHPG